MQKTLNGILKVLFIIFIVIFPSFFLTSFVNVFDFPKTLLLAGFSLLVLIIMAVMFATQSKLTLKISVSDLPLLLLVLVYIASTIFQTQNKMEAFLLPGTTTVIIAGFLVYFFSKIAFGDKESFGLTIFFSGLIVSLFSLFSFIGVFSRIPQLPIFMKDASFSVLGGKLSEVVLLATVLPLGIFAAFKEKDFSKKMFYFVSGLIVLTSLTIAITQIMPGKSTTPVLPDSQTSWSVAVDTLKVSPFLGIGPGNYLTAFSRFLPITYNSGSLWAVRFSSASSFLLTLITETGILGFVAFAISIFFIFKSHLKNLKNVGGSILSLFLISLALLVFPANPAILVLFFLLYSLNSKNEDLILNLSATRVKDGSIFISRVPSIFMSIILIALVGTLFFFAGKVVQAERYYKTAIDAISLNDAKTSYNDLGTAIGGNPYVDRYHATYSQLNMALANSLAQKKDITDADKTTVSQLVQQAISESKATVSLNLLRSGNWELLARTYQAIMPFAQGADNFAIQTYTQAIALDPINPNLRIELGGVYYALGRYNDAINAFSLAITAKPDLANAHYNLAIAYRDNKEIDKAITEMNNVLTLVAPGSQDYTLAKTTLDDLQKNKPIPVTSTNSTQNLTAPQPVAPSNVKPPITLPKEATPPAVTK